MSKQSELKEKENKMVRIGVVGIGNMGSSHCKQLFDGKVEHATLSAVCDIKEERRLWAQDKFGSELLTYQTH